MLIISTNVALIAAKRSLKFSLQLGFDTAQSDITI